MQSFACHRAARCLGITGELPTELLSRQIARLYGPDVLNKEIVRKCNGILSFIDDTIGSGEINSRLIEVPIILEKVQVVTIPDPRSILANSRQSSHDYERTVYEAETLHPALLPEATKCRTGSRRRSSNQRSYVIATRKDVITKRLISAVDFAAWPNKPPIPEGEAGELIRAWLSLATVEAAAASESVPLETAITSMPVENVASTGCAQVFENVKSARAKLHSPEDAKKFSPRFVAQCEAMIDACESLKVDPFCLKDGEKGEIERRVSDVSLGLFNKSNSFRVAYEKAVTEGILCHWRKEQAGRHHAVSEGKGGVLTQRSNGRR